MIFLALFALVPFLPTTFVYVGHLNDGGAFVDPGLWSGWIPAYLILLVILGIIEVWRMAAGTWSRPTLVADYGETLRFRPGEVGFSRGPDPMSWPITRAPGRKW